MVDRWGTLVVGCWLLVVRCWLCPRLRPRPLRISDWPSLRSLRSACRSAISPRFSFRWSDSPPQIPASHRHSTNTFLRKSSPGSASAPPRRKARSSPRSRGCSTAVLSSALPLEARCSRCGISRPARSDCSPPHPDPRHYPNPPNTSRARYPLCQNPNPCPLPQRLNPRDYETPGWEFPTWDTSATWCAPSREETVPTHRSVCSHRHPAYQNRGRWSLRGPRNHRGQRPGKSGTMTIRLLPRGSIARSPRTCHRRD